MGRYIVRRLLQAIPLLIGVSMLGFGMMQLAPGGPLAVYTLNPTVNAQDIERIKHIYGLDQPAYIQYLKWAKGMFTGNWGFSFFGGRPVNIEILERVPATLELMGTAMVIAIILGVLIGSLGAIKRYSIFDYLATDGAMVALSISDVLVRPDGYLYLRPKAEPGSIGGHYLFGERRGPGRPAASSRSACSGSGIGTGGAMEPLHAFEPSGCAEPGLYSHAPRQGSA